MMHIKNYSFFLFTTLMLFAFPSCADRKKDVAMSSILTNKKNNHEIQLYVYTSCPYCKKVTAYLKSSGNLDKVTIIDASKSQNLQELKRLNNNNTQCPFLYDQEKNIKMLESLDIIEYLKKRFAK